MERTFADIIESMGGRVLSTIHADGADAIAPPGEIIHEVGGVCMGDDPSSSVLNSFCQSWEVDNLFVTDGGSFLSNADKNPTLSIMAVAWRATDHLVDELRRGSIG
jgi:choline dehydrogenase-like flavoprotein